MTLERIALQVELARLEWEARPQWMKDASYFAGEGHHQDRGNG